MVGNRAVGNRAVGTRAVGNRAVGGRDRRESAGTGTSTGSVAAASALTAVTALAGGAVLTWTALQRQARATSAAIEEAAVNAAVAAGAIPAGTATALGDIPPPNGDGTYPASGERAPEPDRRPHQGQLTLVMLGDSTAVGYGCEVPDQLPGVLLSRDVAAELERPVRLLTAGRVGATSEELADQVRAAAAVGADLAVIVIGANDITGQIPPHRAAVRLGAAVAALRRQHIEVVVATCPDFGVIAPIPQPLRTLVTRWSHRLAVAQARAVTVAGGVVVPIGRLVSPGFRGRPDLFFADGFHPNAAGYARAVAAMRPAVLEAAHRAVRREPGR